MIKTMDLLTTPSISHLDRLIELKKTSRQEFRVHLCQLFNQYAMDWGSFEIHEIFEVFRIDLYHDSIFYIDAINQILMHLFRYHRTDVEACMDILRFAAEVGDVLTKQILEAALQEVTDIEWVRSEIRTLIPPLTEKLDRIEKQISGVTLYDMHDIYSKWLD